MATYRHTDRQLTTLHRQIMSAQYGAQMRLSLGALVGPMTALALLTSGCGSTADSVDEDSSGASTTKTNESEGKQGRIVESGFGQADQYVWVTALVENLSDRVGQTVTVSFNVKDESGAVVATQSQVEGFTHEGQMLALGTQVDLDPGVKAAAVDATLLVEDNGTFGAEPQPDLGTAKAQVVKSEYGGVEARFSLKNPTAQALKTPRVGIICKDASGKVNGGTSSYPDLVPPSGEIAVAEALIVSGKTARCTAYVAPGI